MRALFKENGLTLSDTGRAAHIFLERHGIEPVRTNERGTQIFDKNQVVAAIRDELAANSQGGAEPTVEPPPGKPVVVLVDGTQHDPGDLGPIGAAGDTGRMGTLPKRVARTATQLERILDEADAKRNEPQLTKDQSAAAAQVKTDVLNALNEIEMKVGQSRYGGMVQTARKQAERWTPNTRKSDWEQEREHYVRGFAAGATDSVVAAMESNTGSTTATGAVMLMIAVTSAPRPSWKSTVARPMNTK